MRLTTRVLLGLAGLAAIAAAAVLARAGGSESSPGSSPGGGGGAVPAAVRVMQPARQDLARELVIPASLMPYEDLDVYAKTSGYVGRVLVDIGDRVRAGDVLVELDIPEMNDELRQAEAKLAARRAAAAASDAMARQALLLIEAARAEVVRAEAVAGLERLTSARSGELFRAQAIPQQELDEAEGKLAIAEASLAIARQDVAGREGEAAVAAAAVEVARAEVHSAEADLDRLTTLTRYARLSSPCDALVTRRHVDPGDFVRSAAGGAGSPVLSLATARRLRLVLEVPETQAALVRPGSPITVSCPALGSGPMELAVSRTAGAVDPATRTMRIEADVDNSDGALMSGVYASARVRTVSVPSALLIPSKAIRAEKGETFVLVARDGVAEAVHVTLGYDDGARAHVTGGLKGDEQIIVEASGAVAAGTVVKAVAR